MGEEAGIIVRKRTLRLIDNIGVAQYSISELPSIARCCRQGSTYNE